jgi:hypothetical protein
MYYVQMVQMVIISKSDGAYFWKTKNLKISSTFSTLHGQDRTAQVHIIT